MLTSKRLLRGTRKLLLCLLLALSACTRGPQAPVLHLEPYQDPNGRFELSIPQDWQADTSAQRLTLTPPDHDPDDPAQLRVVIKLFTSTVSDPNLQMAESRAQLESFLNEYLDQDYQSVNEGETKVARYPAMLVDFGKPWQGGYLTGREVIVPLPVGALAILGTGSEENWNNFLPTFREMLKSFQFTGSLVL